MTETYYKKLRTLPLFVKLTSSTVYSLARKIERKVLYNGQTLLDIGDVPSEMYMLAQGKIIQSIASRKISDPIDEQKA